MSEYKL